MTTPLKKPVIWNKICELIKPKIGETAFVAWIQPIAAKEEGATIMLELPNEFYHDWVIQHYKPLIENTLKNLDSQRSITFSISTSQPVTASTTKPKTPSPKKREAAQSPYFLNPKYTFEEFITGSSNRFTHAACLAIAESPGKAYNPLFIYGKVGLGKTHLMQAICHFIRTKNPKTKFYYTPSEQFTNELISAIQHRSTKAFRDKFRNVDVLLIDDIHFIANKEATQEEFFHTFNTLYDHHKQIIISSDRPPKEIHKLEERLVSRFNWGLVTDIQPPDLETRIAILKKKIENETITIPDEVLFFIAETIKTNIRELEGALVRVIAYSLLEEKPVNLETAKMILKDLFSEAIKNIGVEEIQKTVAEHFKINPQELKTKKRMRQIVLPRQIAMYITRELTTLSLPEIGLYFGGKDHTTVLHSIKKIRKNIHSDTQLKESINKVLLELKQ